MNICFVVLVGILLTIFVVGSCGRPDYGEKNWCHPAEYRIQSMWKALLKYGQSDHVVQIQAFDEHPHEHRSTGIFQQYIGRFAQILLYWKQYKLIIS